MNLADATTLVECLQTLPQTEDRGYHFVGLDREERFFSFKSMYAEARRRGAALQQAGLAKGDRLLVVIPEPHEFVLTFLGAVVAGVVPVPVYPRASFRKVDGYVDTLTHICAAAGAKAIACMEENREIIARVEAREGVNIDRVLVAPDAFQDTEAALAPVSLTSDDLLFLQFTSGSTSRPKGVMVTHANLLANARAFLGPKGLDVVRADVAVSWLPLFHDMGLIGFVLGPLAFDIGVVLMPTEHFGRMPRVWLETISRHRGSITYAPNFAYGLLTKRIRDRDLEQLDLASLRVAGCGAEPIRAQTLRDFADRLAPAGFRPEAFVPSYGMAESTLAISFHDLLAPMLVDCVDAEAMQSGHAKPVAPDATGALELVSCGVAFPEHELAVVSTDGTPCEERRVGEIVLRGPSVTDGYFQNPEATASAWRNGWLHTGDLGYIADGNLYICGRTKDLIIIRGANHYAHDIEWTVGDLEGVRRGNVIAFSVIEDGEERLVIAAEANRRDAAGLRETIPRKVQEEFSLSPDRVLIVPVGALPKTSSGKMQRRRTAIMYESGELLEQPTPTE